MSRVVSNNRVRTVFSIDERDRELLKYFSAALGINESQALVLAVQIANNLAGKVAEGEIVGSVNDKGLFNDDSLTNTMLNKYRPAENSDSDL
ncbi:MAG: hypothetical protein AB8B79_02885 [Granulosicoccus sp.]